MRARRNEGAVPSMSQSVEFRSTKYKSEHDGRRPLVQDAGSGREGLSWTGALFVQHGRAAPLSRGTCDVEIKRVIATWDAGLVPPPSSSSSS